MIDYKGSAHGLKLTQHAIAAPLDNQFGVHPVKTLPEGVEPILFDPDGAERTYALIDGAAVLGVSERLAHLGCEHCCLFSKKALEDFGDVAPWLVRIAPDAGITRELFTGKDATPTGIFGRNAVIFVKSSADLERLRAWLRKFTRLQDAHGTWRFFRFCDSAAMRDLALYSDTRGMILEQMLSAPDPMTFVIPDEQTNESVVVARNETAPPAAMPRPPRLTDQDILVLSDRKRIGQIETLVAKLTRALPGEMSAIDADQHHRQVAHLVTHFERFGFKQLRNLMLLCGWSLRHGPGFAAIDGDGQIARLISADAPEAKRIADIADLVTARSASTPGRAQA